LAETRVEVGSRRLFWCFRRLHGLGCFGLVAPCVHEHLSRGAGGVVGLGVLVERTADERRVGEVGVSGELVKDDSVLG